MQTEAGEEGGHAQADLEGGGGHAADAELGDQRMGRAGPDLVAGRAFDRVRVRSKPVQ